MLSTLRTSSKRNTILKKNIFEESTIDATHKIEPLLQIF